MLSTKSTGMNGNILFLSSQVTTLLNTKIKKFSYIAICLQHLGLFSGRVESYYKLQLKSMSYPEQKNGKRDIGAVLRDHNGVLLGEMQKGKRSFSFVAWL